MPTLRTDKGHAAAATELKKQITGKEGLKHFFPLRYLCFGIIHELFSDLRGGQRDFRKVIQFTSPYQPRPRFLANFFHESIIIAEKFKIERANGFTHFKSSFPFLRRHNSGPVFSRRILTFRGSRMSACTSQAKLFES
ncbi:hypothetical protein CDAR_369271 [Caerostris darwini]|uniref:Uncharacterized protein n=1 Tax=Caerostris darwini TaxID=1538125 RepID=A0AAV4RZ75_9ARAC|nr:hypothetical protein CDAR_369271 [Caerostris darwini]